MRGLRDRGAFRSDGAHDAPDRRPVPPHRRPAVPHGYLLGRHRAPFGLGADGALNDLASVPTGGRALGGRVACSRSPIYAFTMPILVFRMDRSRCSRCGDWVVHVGPIWAFTMDRNQQRMKLKRVRTLAPVTSKAVGAATSTRRSPRRAVHGEAIPLWPLLVQMLRAFVWSQEPGRSRDTRPGCESGNA